MCAKGDGGHRYAARPPPLPGARKVSPRAGGGYPPSLRRGPCSDGGGGEGPSAPPPQSAPSAAPRHGGPPPRGTGAVQCNARAPAPPPSRTSWPCAPLCPSQRAMSLRPRHTPRRPSGALGYIPHVITGAHPVFVCSTGAGATLTGAALWAQRDGLSRPHAPPPRPRSYAGGGGGSSPQPQSLPPQRPPAQGPRAVLW